MLACYQIMKSSDVWWMLPLSLSDQVLKPVTLKAASCMVCNCRKQIVDCQKDPTCKAALACLENCAPNDQVWPICRDTLKTCLGIYTHLRSTSFAPPFPPLCDRLDLRMGGVSISRFSQVHHL